MSVKCPSIVVAGLRLVAFLTVGAMAAWTIEPTRWLLSGSNPSGYESGVDAATKRNGLPSTYLKARTAEVSGFGTLMLDIRAQEYRGKRLRLRASVKSKDARQWAGLWMRVDKSRGATPLAFDNMHNRPIQGSTDWQSYDVVLDVAEDASTISFGILLTDRDRYGSAT
jgi:hypothetical protein